MTKSTQTMSSSGQCDNIVIVNSLSSATGSDIARPVSTSQVSLSLDIHESDNSPQHPSGTCTCFLENRQSRRYPCKLLMVALVLLLVCVLASVVASVGVHLSKFAGSTQTPASLHSLTPGVTADTPQQPTITTATEPTYMQRLTTTTKTTTTSASWTSVDQSTVEALETSNAATETNNATVLSLGKSPASERISSTTQQITEETTVTKELTTAAKDLKTKTPVTTNSSSTSESTITTPASTPATLTACVGSRKCHSCSSFNSRCPANGRMAGTDPGEVMNCPCDTACFSEIRRLNGVHHGCTGDFPLWDERSQANLTCQQINTSFLCFCLGDRCNTHDMTVYPQYEGF